MAVFLARSGHQSQNNKLSNTGSKSNQFARNHSHISSFHDRLICKWLSTDKLIENYMNAFTGQKPIRCHPEPRNIGTNKQA
jgi:hypothetical protein